MFSAQERHDNNSSSAQEHDDESFLGARTKTRHSNKLTKIPTATAAPRGISIRASGHGGGGSASSGAARGYGDREEVVAWFEERLEVAKWAARAVGGAYALSRFIAYCDLTWASVVLLGGFVASLEPRDFEWVTALLLFEAARLSFAAFFSGLLTRGLTTLTRSPPTELGSARLPPSHGFDPRLGRTLLTRTLSLLLQVLLIVPSIIISASLLLDTSNAYSKKIPIANISSAVRIFYILILINCFVSLIAVLSYILAFCLLNWPEHSFLCYFDTVLENILINGRSLIDADRFSFADFAYKLLGRELGRNMSSDMVGAHYKRMLEYLFAVRQGEDHLVIYLDYPEALVQQAAANMLGFWLSDHMGLQISHLIRNLPESLVAKLVHKFGAGQVGWAAAQSIHALARKLPELVLDHGTKPSGHVVDSINPASSRSLVFVKTLVFLVHSQVSEREAPPRCVASLAPLNRIFDATHLGLLEQKLHKIVTLTGLHARFRAVSAYLLMLLNSPLLPGLELMIQQHIDMTQGYWYASEVDMIETLYSYFGIPPGDTPIPGEIRNDTPLQRPRWIRNIGTPRERNAYN